jgi:Protein of unknown function (DUF1761)
MTMVDVGLVPILVSAVVVFVVSSGWYVAFGAQRAAMLAQTASGVAAAESADRPPVWKMLVELGRSAVVATLIALLVGALSITDLPGALALGLGLWVAFPVVLLVGSVIWDDVPPAMAALHAGDWLLKLLIIALIVTIWP